jgi:hypothetical protein
VYYIVIKKARGTIKILTDDMSHVRSMVLAFK